MSKAVHELFGEDPYVPTTSEAESYYAEQMGVNGSGSIAKPWESEPWSHFRDTSEEEPRWLVQGLLPEGALVFVAAPPKKGKTWLALAIALSIVSGRSLFGEYAITEPRPVLYVALEGSRAALRARTGALARGLGVDPDGDDLEMLHFLYRPRPLDLAGGDSARWLLEEQRATGAAFVIVDVLRAAARIRENAAEDFALVRDALDPMLDEGCSAALLHHFGKLSDTQKERMPGERMAGTGAMYGALDVGFLITQSENGARRLRVDLEARDFATPEALGLVIEGTGTGEHGGFRYIDVAAFVIDDTATEERNLIEELDEMFSDGKWRTNTEIAKKKLGGIGVDKAVVTKVLEDAIERFRQVSGDDAKAVGRAANSKPWGTISMWQEVFSGVKTHKTQGVFQEHQLVVVSGGVSYGDTPTTPPEATAGVAAENTSTSSASVMVCRKCATTFRRGTGNRGDICAKCVKDELA